MDEMVPLVAKLPFPTTKTGLTATQINSASWSLAVGISFRMLVVLLPSIVIFILFVNTEKAIKVMRFLNLVFTGLKRKKFCHEL
jgi:hypothetical protein